MILSYTVIAEAWWLNVLDQFISRYTYSIRAYSTHTYSNRVLVSNLNQKSCQSPASWSPSAVAQTPAT